MKRKRHDQWTAPHKHFAKWRVLESARVRMGWTVPRNSLANKKQGHQRREIITQNIRMACPYEIFAVCNSTYDRDVPSVVHDGRQ